MDTWLTDFRADLLKIDVPVLLIHGDADRILPYAATAARLPALIKDLTFVTVEGGPHNVAWTYPDVVNPALLDFLAQRTASPNEDRPPGCRAGLRITVFTAILQQKASAKPLFQFAPRPGHLGLPRLAVMAMTWANDEGCS